MVLVVFAKLTLEAQSQLRAGGLGAFGVDNVLNDCGDFLGDEVLALLYDGTGSKRANGVKVFNDLRLGGVFGQVALNEVYGEPAELAFNRLCGGGRSQNGNEDEERKKYCLHGCLL